MSSEHNENLKAAIMWALKMFCGPHAATIPVNALDALLDRSENTADAIAAVRDRLPATGAASEGTLEALRLLIDGRLPSGGAATEATLEAVRSLVAGTLSTRSARELVGSGNITSAGSAFTLALPPQTAAVAIMVSGTYAGVSFQADVSEDSVLFDNGIRGYTAQGGASLVTFTPGTNATKRYVFPVNGAAFLRIRATAWTNGTANVVAYALPNFAGMPGSTTAVTQSGTWTVQPGNTANTTPWLVTLRPGTTGGLARHRCISTASTNAVNVKASAGQVYTIHGHNAGGADRYLKIYNKATAPVPGTDTPVETYVLKAGQPFRLDFSNHGNPFATGIGYAITAGLADADTGAIAADEVVMVIHHS
ncbi:MAG: hypothetical protein ACK4UT_07975 [Moraxellaceae bacterium]